MVLTAVLFNSCCLTNHFVPYAIVQPGRCDDAVTLKHFPRGLTPEAYELTSSPLDITVEDTISLKGWFIHSQSDSARGTIIVVHGNASCKEHQLGIAEFLAHEGFNSILFDLRAHGKSGGKYNTFGDRERYDISALIDSAAVRFSNPGPFGILGSSLGGAIALQAMAVDKRLVCGISESTFARLDEVVRDYIRAQSMFGTRRVADSALRRAGEIADFDPQSVAPEEAARDIEQPVFIAHGTADANISVDYSRRIYDNLQTAEKVWYPVEGADHFNLWKIGGDSYKIAVVKFLDTWMP